MKYFIVVLMSLSLIGCKDSNSSKYKAGEIHKMKLNGEVVMIISLAPFLTPSFCQDYQYVIKYKNDGKRDYVCEEEIE